MGNPIGIPAAPPAAGRRAAWTSIGLAATFVLSWSSGFIGAKLGASDAPTPTVLMWRFVPLVAVLLPLALSSRPRWTLRGRSRSEVARHVLIGALSQTGYLLAVNGAIGLGVSTGTTALVDGVQPLVAAALVGPLLGVAVPGRQWVGLALGLAGVALVSCTDATSPATTAPAWAYLVPALGMLSLVGATILERRAPVRTSPGPALAVHCTTSAVAFTGLALATGDAAPPAAGGFWLAMAWLVVLPTFGGYGLYWVLVERLGVTPVNGLMFLVAPVTALWGAAMFGEPLTVVTGVGLALTLVAALAVAHVRPARSERVGPDAPRPTVAGPDEAATAPPRCRPGAGRGVRSTDAAVSDAEA